MNHSSAYERFIFFIGFYLLAGAVANGQDAEIRFFPIRTAALGSPGGTVGDPLTPIYNGDLGCWEVITRPGVEVDLAIQGFGWGQTPENPMLGAVQATLDHDSLASGLGAPLNPKGWPANPGEGWYMPRSICGGPEGDGAPCVPPFDVHCGGAQEAYCIPDPNWIMPPCASDEVLLAVPPYGYAWATVALYTEDCTLDEGLIKHFGGLILDVPPDAMGTYIIRFVDDTNETFMTSGQGSVIPTTLTPACITVACQTDGDCDDGDICTIDLCTDGICGNESVVSAAGLGVNRDSDAGTYGLVTGNAGDCNGNAIPDVCEIEAGTSADCDLDGIPDECRIAALEVVDCGGFIGPCYGGPFFCTSDCDPDLNGNGIIDACDCPSGRIEWIDPPNGIIDARQPHSVRTNVPLQGLQEFIVAGPRGIENLACWSVCESATPLEDENKVVSVVGLPHGKYAVTLHRVIAAHAYTEITYTDFDDRPSAGRFGFLPGDVDGDTLVEASDILTLIECLNGAANPPCGYWQTDIDRSGVSNPQDILRLIDLLNGAGEYNVWLTRWIPWKCQ